MPALTIVAILPGHGRTAVTKGDISRKVQVRRVAGAPGRTGLTNGQRITSALDPGAYDARFSRSSP